MARLPQTGGDSGNWGAILNDYLLQAHDANGSLKQNTVGSAQLQTDSVTNDSIANGSITEAQLDTALSTKINSNVTLTGAQTITGAKTFSTSPIVPTPVAPTAATNKAYVDSSIVASGHSGRELAYADTSTELIINSGDNGWHYVPGLTVSVGTTDRPAYITGNLGLIIVETAEYCNVLISILNETDMNDLFHQEIQVVAAPDGFGVASVPPITVRIPAGTPAKSYVVRIQSFHGKKITAVPTWSTNKPSLFVIEA